MTDSILKIGFIVPEGNYDGGRLIITNRVTKLMIDTILERRVIAYTWKYGIAIQMALWLDN